MWHAVAEESVKSTTKYEVRWIIFPVGASALSLSSTVLPFLAAMAPMGAWVTWHTGCHDHCMKLPWPDGKFKTN